MKTERLNVNGLIFDTRVGTSDAKSIKKVVEDKGYQRRYFMIESGENWLDLGCNIGAFSCFASQKGAIVTAYEPEPNNVNLARHNIGLNDYSVTVNQCAVVSDNYKQEYMRLYLSNTDYGQWRHSLYKSKNKRFVNVPVVKFSSLLDGVDGVKMDIEGAEIDILQNIKSWGNVKKLCLQYHFDINNSIPLFLKIMDELKQIFDVVKHGKMPDGELEYKWFPPARIVFAYNEPEITD